MDAKDIRNIQEAYMEVVENQQLDESFADRIDKQVKKNKEYAKKRKPVNTSSFADRIDKQVEQRKKEKDRIKEQVDTYDIILSHLLDEGYAETEEAAHKIMVNMSEDWRESIVEARKKVKIDTQKPIEYKIADIGPGKKEYNVKTSKGWKEEVEPDPFGRPGGKHGGVRKGGGYEKGYEAMKKKIKELEDKK